MVTDAELLPPGKTGDFEVVDNIGGPGQEIWLIRETNHGRYFKLAPQVIKLELRTGAMYCGAIPSKVTIR